MVLFEDIIMALFVAGSATAEDSKAAGQPKDSKDVNKESCNTERTTTDEHRVVFSLAKDTDSVESLDMQSKTEHDTDTQADAMDATDSGLFPPRMKRLSSSDSYLSHQDSMKSMPWYGSSLDFDVGPYGKCAGLESQQSQLDKISESSLEPNLEDLHLGHGCDRTMNRTSTPAHEVRLAGEEEMGSPAPLKLVKVGFDLDMGGRSSPDSSGRGLFVICSFVSFSMLDEALHISLVNGADLVSKTSPQD